VVAPLRRQLGGAAERRSGRGHGRGLTGAEEGGAAELTGKDGSDWRRRSVAGWRRHGFRTAAFHGFGPWQRRGAQTLRSERWRGGRGLGPRCRGWHVRRGEGGVSQRRRASDTGCRSEPAFNPHARVEDDAVTGGSQVGERRRQPGPAQREGG
jgi:hypothetical protein